MEMCRPTGNVILFIAVCTVYVCMAYGETCFYTGTCYQQERYTESCGWWWGASTCSHYRTVSKSCTLPATCNYSLSSCGSCSATCGGGTQSCTYQCSTTYCSLLDIVQIHSCNTQMCPPVNGGWGPWASWTSAIACSVTCGGGTQTEIRARSCNTPVPQNGGSQCSGSSTDFQTIPCILPTCPAVHGNWSGWSGWISNGTCSVTCGGGIHTQIRNRSCTNPIPQNGGRQCNGSSTESQTIQCNIQACPTDGGWSAWNGWTSNGTCSVTCGGGIQTQTRGRSCNNPIPENGGRQCAGTLTEFETVQCNTQSCPIDGDWSVWNCWSSNGACSVTCGGGIQTQTRGRSCTSPIPKNGGRQCNGTSTEFQTIQCNTQICPIDGDWSAWNGWTSNGTCSVTCGAGIQTQTRSRSCTNPIPQNGGRQCNGTSMESDVIQCNTQTCPIDGNWSAWSGWISNGSCSVTCGGGIQTQTRNRSCTNPIPQNGGGECIGTSTEYLTFTCNTQACPLVDGHWSEWSDWTSDEICSVTCGGGIQTQTRNRSCTNPIPQNGGRKCNGTSTESKTIECSKQTCPTGCNNGDKKENSKDCGKYLICASNTWQEMRCNSSTVFNPLSKSCDWPVNVPMCRNAFATTATTAEPSVTQGSECNSVNCVCDKISDRYIKHPTDCTKFIRCVSNNAIIFSCPDGAYWDQSQLTCGHGTC